MNNDSIQSSRSEKIVDYVEIKTSKESGASILIVDDQMFLLDVLKTIMADFGLDSDVAIGGLEAIRMVRQRYSDIEEGLIL